MTFKAIPPAAAPSDVFIAAELQRCNPHLRKWISDAQLRKNVETWIGEVYGWIDDEEFGAAFRERCLIPDTSPADYRPAIFQLSSGMQILAGIRFRDLETTRPFVHITAFSRHPVSDGDIAEAVEGLRTAFASFKPRWILLLDLANDLQAAAQPFNAASGDRYMVGRLGEMAAKGEHHAGADIKVERRRDVNFYPTYLDAYARYTREVEDFSDFARPEDRETLDELAQADGCFEIAVDGREAGIMAVDSRSDTWVNGSYVVEFVLWPEFRGRGISAAVQRRIARLLNNPESLLIGTIHCRNVPAFRSALRAGREDIGGHLWLPLR